NYMKSNYRIATLDNGMRIGLRHSPDSMVSYIGVAVNAGSRDEKEDCHGLAHFVEHTIFKGTRSRRSWHISNRMESIGGELNAYTSKEETLIYTNAPAGNAERAIELLYDIIANSRFPAQELDKEREVIVEEINSYLDSPADSIYDEFEELIYPDSALAHNILGTPESVRRLDSADCRGFLDRWYTPANMTAYISDPGDPDRLIRLMEKYFGRLDFASTPHHRQEPRECEGFDKVVDRDGHQAHTLLGFRVFGRKDPRRYPLFLLNNYLGGPCMNSRLNQELREKRGLVYTVDSNVSLLSDCGTMMIYFGCDRAGSDRCVRLVKKEIERLAETTLSARSFEALRNQYCGQLLVSSDQSESMAMSMAKSLLYYDSIHDISEMTRHIREVTAGEFRSMAEMLASSPTARLTIR
ncbi:MAG: insulinase family protein, partial [Muribaculaceae bacterium]|nr:insulinase family protein [Muribaculaceae bacterium]